MSSSSPFPHETRYFKAGIYSGSDNNPYSIYRTSSSVHGPLTARPSPDLNYPRSFPDSTSSTLTAHLSGHCRNFVPVEFSTSKSFDRSSSLYRQEFPSFSYSREPPVKPLSLQGIQTNEEKTNETNKNQLPLKSAVSLTARPFTSRPNEFSSVAPRPHSRTGYIRNQVETLGQAIHPSNERFNSSTYQDMFEEKFTAAFARTDKKFQVPPFKKTEKVQSEQENQRALSVSSVPLNQFKTSKCLDNFFIDQLSSKPSQSLVLPQLTSDSEKSGWIKNFHLTLEDTELDIPRNRQQTNEKQFQTTANLHFDNSSAIGGALLRPFPPPLTSVVPFASSAYTREHLNQTIGANESHVKDRLRRIHGKGFIHPTIRKQMALDAVAANKNWGRPKPNDLI
jgi:hypothetical protein